MEINQPDNALGDWLEGCFRSDYMCSDDTAETSLSRRGCSSGARVSILLAILHRALSLSSSGERVHWLSGVGKATTLPAKPYLLTETTAGTCLMPRSSATQAKYRIRGPPLQSSGLSLATSHSFHGHFEDIEAVWEVAECYPWPSVSWVFLRHHGNLWRRTKSRGRAFLCDLRRSSGRLGGVELLGTLLEVGSRRIS
jgi:hypothetical protein